MTKTDFTPVFVIYMSISYYTRFLKSRPDVTKIVFNSVKTARSVLKCYTHVLYINLTERRNFLSYIIKMALDIKARFNPPAHMSSPIEAYCAIELLQSPWAFLS